MPVTLKDISAKSGYSVTTVSRALTGYDDVSAETKAQILKIADELGYQPNYIARQLKAQRTYTIGLVMPARDHTAEDDFFSMLLKGITYEAARNGFDVLVSAIHNEHEEMEAYRRIAGGKRVDGMIFARTHRDDPRMDYLNSIKCPFIVHGRLTPDQDSDFHYIDVDSQLGIYMVVEYLIEMGHRNIGIILPGEDVAFTPYRLAGYQQALEKYNITFDPQNCIHSDLTFEGGKRATHELLNRERDLTAIVGCNDWMALGALTVAKERGLPVGEQFAVAGYDDIPASRHSQPTLTTIRTPIFEIGEQLTQELIKLIESSSGRTTPSITQRLITPQLVVRDSSGQPLSGKESI